MELYAKNKEDWHNWLELNHSQVQGIWLVYYKKTSGKMRISYDDAVEEALCFGWIDGKIKSVNDDYYMQWFTPRRHGSRWSKLNLSRIEKLIGENRMKPAGLAAYEEVVKNPDLVYKNRSEISCTVPDDLIEALKVSPIAYDNFMNFPPSSRKLYVMWLNDAKREETRIKRIIRIVDQSERNIKAGMM